MKKILLALTLLASASQAFAQDAFVVTGSKPGTASGLVAYSSNSTFNVRSLKDRSTYCRYRSSVNVDWGLSPIVGCFTGTCPTGRLVGDAELGIDNIFGEDDAIAFIANQDDRFTITLESVSPSPSNLVVECFNTTLYGNFNTVTVANPFNFLELSNDSDISINARVVITGNNGTVLSTGNFTINAGAQRDIAIHDAPGAANTFGRITVAHDGALHGLRANMTKYTSSFAITASTPLATRANEQ